MAYPPEYSSTISYENRYDLDKKTVFLEGDGLNPMFFKLTGLPDQLTFGKHYFQISTLNVREQQYRLRTGSRILFEFKSINDVILRSDIVDTNHRNGVIACFVEVLKDPFRTRKEVEDGVGTFTILASLENKPPNLDLGVPTTNPIPEKFKGAMNYRCTWPIEIRKNLISAASPRILQSKHKMQTTMGQFSFAKGSISANRNSTIGSTYDQTGDVVSSAHYSGGGATS